MPNPHTTIYLSLGSNLGDREGYLQKALELLEESGKIILYRSSSIYETDPVGITNQPMFLNLVVQGKTSYTPHELLHQVQEVERKLGRTREIRWGPRTIDIDILLYNHQQINEQDLTIPHPRMKERGFVLVPLREIAGNLVIPGEEETVAELAARLSEEGVRLWKSPLPLGADVLEPLEN